MSDRLEVMDVVIPLGAGAAPRNDWELRFSLRSLWQNFEGLGKVWIVGPRVPGWMRTVDAPGWGEVGHIVQQDPYPRNKDGCLIGKFVTACADARVSDVFLATSDDHYLMRPCSAEDLDKYWLENPSQLPISYKRMHESSWHARLVRTAKLVEKLGLPVEVFESHIGYPIRKADYPAAMLSVPWGDGIGFVTHVYANLVRHHRAVMDCGYELAPEWLTWRVKELLTREEIAERWAACPSRWLNHDNRGLSEALVEFVEGAFPTAAPWEM